MHCKYISSRYTQFDCLQDVKEDSSIMIAKVLIIIIIYVHVGFFIGHSLLVWSILTHNK